MGNIKFAERVEAKKKLCKQLSDVMEHLESACRISTYLEWLDKEHSTEITNSLIDLLAKSEEVEDRVWGKFRKTEAVRYTINRRREERLNEEE